MKISIITPRFSLAGVPLAQIRFAKSLLHLGHEVTLIIGYINKGYELPNIEGISVKILGKKKVVYMFFDIIKHLIYKKPHIIFSAEDHLNIVVLISIMITRSKIKVSCSSRVTPFDTYSDKFFSKRWILKQFMKLVMNKATSLTCVSKDMVKQYQTVFNNAPHTCIYNIIDTSEAQDKMLETLNDPIFDKNTPMVIAAGRLAPWKGFSDLIFAIKKVSNVTDVRLTILGGGPLKKELGELIKKLNLENVVELKGYVANPLKYFKKSDVFVLSSYVEGLPNVLVEAIMCECTPVSTDCPTGPREVLKDGLYGYLTPVADIDCMADNIIKALKKPIPNNVLKAAVDRFSERRVLEDHRKALKVSHYDFYPKERRV
jgi:glycosyltransferase involved in cell wall biosynthesis